MKKIIISYFFHLLPLLALSQKPELVVPIGHTSGEVSAVFSPDGKLILTHSDDDPVAKLWDLSGNELHSYQPEEGDIVAATFSPDGTAVLTEILIETEEFWDIQICHAWKLNGQEWSSFDKMMDNVTYAKFTQDGQSVITGNREGIVKIWDLNGREIQSIKAHNGKVSLITISPDGKFMVTGSRDVNTYEFVQKFWDLGNRKMIRDLENFSSLAFDHGSQFLLEEGFGVEDSLNLLDLNGEVVKVFEGYTRAAFSPDGRFIILQRRSEPIESWEIKTGRTQNFEQDATIAFSPNGQYLLRGNKHREAVELIHQQTKESRIVATFANGVNQLAFSPDGKYFLTSGIDENSTTLQLHNIETQVLQASKTFSGVVSFLGFSPDQQSLLISNWRKIEILNADLMKRGSISGYTNKLSSVFFSEDTTSIIIEDYSGNRSWDLRSNKIRASVEAKPFYAGFTGDVLWSPDRDYIFGAGADEPTPALYPQSDEAMQAVFGKERNFEGHTSSIISAAFSADGQLILTGSMDRTARLWNLYGENLQTFQEHSGKVWSVAFRPDRRLILTATDQMIKLWQPDSPRELISLIQIDSADWIVTTPSGLFDASPGAMNLMHYSLFYERDQEYIVIDVEQLKARYYEPGLLQKVLGYSDERVRPVEAFNIVKLYPEIEAEVLQDSLHIDLHERNGGIGKVSIFINGKEVAEEINPLPRRENPKRDSIIRYDLKQHQNYFFRHPDSTNIISIRAYNEEGWLKTRAIELAYKIPAARARGSSGQEDGSAWIGQLDPKLYVVSIGTSNYAGTKMDLQYADQDATMMARALQAVGTALIANSDSLEVHCLTTAEPGATGVEGTPISWRRSEKSEIESIFTDIKKRAKAEDVIIVYLSGHGVTYGSADLAQFHYLTQGIAGEDLSDAAIRQAYTISSEELTDWLKAIPALKQVLIIDACNSGQVVENLTGGAKALNSSQIRALDRMKDRTGMFVLSGSAADKVSYEAGEYGQGLLTYALLEGMLSATRKTTDGEKVVEMIDVMTLFQHARDRVPELAATINGIQTPMLGFPSRAASFDIGILDETAKAHIPLGNKKPVIIRSTFFNQATFKDDLKLADRLEAALREEAEKGADADFIYVDVYDYPGAYTLSGLYNTSGNDIVIQLKLFEPADGSVDLEIRPTNDPERLVRYMLRAVRERLDKQQDINK